MMNYEQQVKLIDLHNDYSTLDVNQERLDAKRNELVDYIQSNPGTFAAKQLRLGLAENLIYQQLLGRTVYHLVITYKPYADRVYKEQDVNKFFSNFYTRHFLPHLVNTKNYHRTNKLHLQPVCYAFIDEHENSPEVTWNLRAYGELEPKGKFSERLHHHAMIAIHPDHKHLVDKLVGTNTLANTGFSQKIMTSFLEEREPTCLLYASKLFDKYPNYLIFTGSAKPANKDDDEFYRAKRASLAALSAKTNSKWNNYTAAVDLINKSQLKAA